MRKLFLAGAALAVVLITFASTALASTITGAANLHPIDNSGIQANITFTDNGTTLTVNGTATGLVPKQTYFTLVYDVGSKPSGPAACEPPPTNDQTEAQMIVGFWVNNGDGTGTLHAAKSGPSYVALSDIHTTSVRHVVGAPPEGFILQACGEVHHLA